MILKRSNFVTCIYMQLARCINFEKCRTKTFFMEISLSCSDFRLQSLSLMICFSGCLLRLHFKVWIKMKLKGFWIISKYFFLWNQCCSLIWLLISWNTQFYESLVVMHAEKSSRCTDENNFIFKKVGFNDGYAACTIHDFCVNFKDDFHFLIFFQSLVALKKWFFSF